MKERASISDSLYEEELLLAERELSSFLAAVAELYGQQQAGLAAEDWLHESALMEHPPRSGVRKWRAVTIAAAARLAHRVNAKTE
jgi:hypothetical protein